MTFTTFILSLLLISIKSFGCSVLEIESFAINEIATSIDFDYKKDKSLFEADQAFSNRIIYVSKAGSDLAFGDSLNPVLSISRAVELANPGDIVLIHEGVYREQIIPVRGGTSDTSRIVFMAAKGETVVVKGSELIQNWEKYNEKIWSVVLSDSFFGDYNPYKTKLSGDYFEYGTWHNTGQVYLNQMAFVEKRNSVEIAHDEYTWCVVPSDTGITILANFGSYNPNTELTEINVKETLFYPEVPGLSYITIDGLTFTQAATNWQSPRGEQKAMIGTNGGHHWAIKNCDLSHSRCTGISIGNPSEDIDLSDISIIGHHYIANNRISQCGEAGICGRVHNSFSTITGNIIEEINAKLEFGGYETAGIKFHCGTDVLISDNIIRGVSGIANAGPGHGIWIDYGNQGGTVANNIIHDITGATVFFECNAGPFFVYNNIFAGTILNAGSSDLLFVSNLFLNSHFSMYNQLKRLHWNYFPHTLTRDQENIPSKAENIRFYNNLFFGCGFDLPFINGIVAEKNAFCNFGLENNNNDEKSYFTNRLTEYIYKSCRTNFKLNFILDELPYQQISDELTGIHSFYPELNSDVIYKAAFEKMNFDFFGNLRDSARFTPGPFLNLETGKNTLVFMFRDENEYDKGPEMCQYSGVEKPAVLQSAFSANDQCTYRIGDDVEGGLIFFLNSEKPGSGYALVVAKEDLRDAQWNDMMEKLETGRTDESTYMNAKNEEKKILIPGAISLADDFIHNGYADWYLPETNELHFLFDVINSLNFILKTDNDPSSFPVSPAASYWSANEATENEAWIQNMKCGTQSRVPKNSVCKVRPIRKFVF